MHSGTWVLPKETYSARVTGQCLCGAVQWSYDAPFDTFLYCHCSVCRKHHGSLFAATVVGALDTFHWRAGTEKIGTWESSPQERRSFCTVCGSKVPRVDHDSRRVFMPAGGLTGELGLRPQLHLFVGSKPAWHLLHDSLPRHDAYPPGWPAHAVDTVPRPVREGVASGSCACDRVRYELEGRPQFMGHCHCSRCRRSRGAPHSTNLAWKIDALRYTRGEECVTVYDYPEAQHYGTTFCSHCGGLLPRRSHGRGWAIVPAGTMDTEPDIHAGGHIFVGSKASWFEITDGLPQFAEGIPR